MKIGMIVAIISEMKQLLNTYGDSMREIHKNGYTLYECQLKGHQVYVIQSGAGEIGAAATAQLLITGFDVELIVNYGVVGALNPSMDLAETVIVKDVVHYDYDTSEIDHCEVGRYLEFDSVYVASSQKYIEKALQVYPPLRAVRCASADKFVNDPQQKIALNKKFKADICDMESAGIILTCRRNQIDSLLIKAVSDTVEGGAEEFNNMVERSAKVCMDVLLNILNTLD